MRTAKRQSPKGEHLIHRKRSPFPHWGRLSDALVLLSFFLLKKLFLYLRFLVKIAARHNEAYTRVTIFDRNELGGRVDIIIFLARKACERIVRYRLKIGVFIHYREEVYLLNAEPFGKLKIIYIDVRKIGFLAEIVVHPLAVNYRDGFVFYVLFC